MRLSKILCLAAGLFLTACEGKPPVKQSAASIDQTSPIIIGESFTLNSDITGQAHEINVWIPPSIDMYGEPSAPPPVLYLIDGGQEQDFQHIAGLAQLASISNRFSAPLVVGIDTSNRYYQLTPQMTDPRYLPWNGPDKDAPEMGGADDFSAMIQSELRPLIEAKYSHNQQRIIMGESLAGFFTLREFLRKPEGFTHYIAISPSLWLDDRALARQAQALLAQHKVDADGPHSLYVAMADEGGTMQDGVNRVLSAIDSAGLSNLSVTYADRSQIETHSTIYHNEALTALTLLFGQPQPDYGPDPWYLREGGQPEDDAAAQ